jgi:hypothetical protein
VRHPHGRLTVAMAFSIHLYLAFFVALVLIGTSSWGALGGLRGESLALALKLYVPTLFIIPFSVMVSSWCYRIWPLPLMVISAFAAVVVYTPSAGLAYVLFVLGLTGIWFGLLRSRPVVEQAGVQ